MGRFRINVLNGAVIWVSRRTVGRTTQISIVAIAGMRCRPCAKSASESVSVSGSTIACRANPRCRNSSLILFTRCCPYSGWRASSGIGAVGVANVISLAFVVANLFIWRLEYGKTLAGPFLTMLTRRDAGEDDY